ncbi:unnamed protein product, partial [Iphiclides podalirius]
MPINNASSQPCRYRSRSHRVCFIYGKSPEGSDRRNPTRLWPVVFRSQRARLSPISARVRAISGRASCLLNAMANGGKLERHMPNGGRTHAE